MDLGFTPQEEAFRNEVRSWLDLNLPSEWRNGGVGGYREDADATMQRGWQKRLHEGGWLKLSWPRETGGRGATPVMQAIYHEEMAKAGAPVILGRLGVSLLAPTLLVHGSAWQKEMYVEKILGGALVFCQGFSEPDAGSDLAALKTRAVRDGDDWLVTGQKVWTSGAQYSKWCMLVARTDQDAPKHKGLSYFLMDMEQDAVEVLPLTQITGEAEFNELFLQEARIPHENLLGGEGNGWKVALTTLMNERSGLGFFLQIRLRQLLDKLIDEAAARDLLSDSQIADRIGDLHVKTEVLRLNGYRGLTAIEKYGQPGPEGSLSKLMWSQTNQELVQLAVDIVGAQALTAGTPWAYELLRARGNSIEGGTTEILQNIIAERVLGLPKNR